MKLLTYEENAMRKKKSTKNKRNTAERKHGIQL